MDLKTVILGYLRRLDPGSAIAFWVLVAAVGWCVAAGLIATVLT